jgi:hypothetical protein
VPRLPTILVLAVAGACTPAAPSAPAPAAPYAPAPAARSAGGAASAAPAAPPCEPLDLAAREAETGSLHRARALLEPAARFCDAPRARVLLAGVLVDLAEYALARQQLEALPEARRGEGAALAAELERRARPRSDAEIAAARETFERAFAAPYGKDAEALFRAAWSADPPSGPALLGAALAMRQRGESGPAVQRLLERGAAELEKETGLPAHAGIAAPPACVGHFSNYLEPRFLPDGAHATVRCTDGVVVADLRAPFSPVRVAQVDFDPHAWRLDPRRLPRLRFTAMAGEDAHDDVAIPLEQPEARAAVELGEHAVTLREAGAPRWTRELPLRTEARLAAATLSRDGRLVFAIAEDAVDPSRREGDVWILDAGGGGLRLHLAAHRVAELAGGRIAVAGHGELVILDRGLRRQARFVAPDGDLSRDGALLLFTRPGPGDEMYHPLVPWIRRLDTGAERTLAGVLEAPEASPATLDGPRLAAGAPSSCAALGTMLNASSPCARPGFLLAGRRYGSNDDLACEGEGRRWSCVDPRGPVRAADPFRAGLVCRIGPHVLPLGACPHLLAPR